MIEAIFSRWERNGEGGDLQEEAEEAGRLRGAWDRNRLAAIARALAIMQEIDAIDARIVFSVGDRFFGGR